MRTLEILMHITEVCNLKCRHCYLSCGPRGRTMSMEETEKALKSLPSYTLAVGFTGGEPLVKRKTLMHAVSYLNKSRERLDFNATIGMQTNGFWAKDENAALETIRQLYMNGMNFVIITSDDRYHREQGLLTDRLRMEKGTPMYNAVERLGEEIDARLEVYDSLGGRCMELIPKGSQIGIERGITFRLGGAEGQVLPVGRAKNMPKEEMMKSDCVCRGRLVSIAADGSAYLCNLRIPPSIGNVFELPLEVLLDKAEQNPVYRALLEGGITCVAQTLGVYRGEEEEIYRTYPCLKCEEIFRGIGTCVPGFPSRGSGGLR